MLPLLDLHDVSRRSYWAGQRHGAIPLLADAGLIAAYGSEGGGVCWAPTEAGRRVLATAGGCVRIVLQAQRLGPATEPGYFERSRFDHEGDLREVANA